jgi:hypothetical protein
MGLVAQIDIEGLGAVISALVLFCGSVFLLLAAIFGIRMGYLMAATGFFGLLLILALLWAFGAPGTPAYLGPKGTLPHWDPVGAGQDVTSPNFPVIDRYPQAPWHEPGGAETPEVEGVTTALQEFLAEEANADLEARGVEGQVVPEDFQLTNMRFTEVDGTKLAAVTAVAGTGGREVEAVAVRDEGNEGLPSFISLGIAVIGLGVHLPLLDRAERRRKDVLTGGDQAPWRGPA